MRSHQFGDQSEPEPRAVGLCRHERLEEVLTQVAWHAWPVVHDPDLDRSPSQILSSRGAHAHTMAIGRVDADSATPVAARMRSFGGVLYEVQEDLDQLILVAKDLWERRIILLAQDKAVSHSIGRKRTDPIEHLMDIPRAK